MRSKSKSNWLLLAEVLTLAGIYLACGRFGLSQAFVNKSVSAVWPPTGLALAALLLRGYRLWPGVFVGAFLVNFLRQGTVATTLGIATGNTLEALVGAWLVCHFADGAKAFWRVKSIFAYVLLAALLSTAISATVGVTSLCLGGFEQWQHFPAVWLTWWLGDMVSDLIVAPLLVIWAVKGLPRPAGPEVLEAAALALLLALVCQTVFLEREPFGGQNLPLEYLTVPPLLWAAFRFKERGAVTSAFFVSAVALWGTRHSLGPFARPDPNQALLLLQAFMGTITLTAMVLALVVLERQRAEQRLQVQDAVSRVLAEAATLAKATPRIFQALCEKGDWEFGAIWNVDQASRQLFCVEVWHVSSIQFPAFEALTRQTRLDSGIGLPGRVWAGRKPVWVSDVTQDTNFPRATAAVQDGLHSAVCFPIKHGDEVLGIIECLSRTERKADEDFLRMVEGLGGQVGQFIERENALAKQAYLANIVASSTDAIISISLAGQIASWNKGAETIFGFTAEEAIGKPISMLLPEGQAGREPDILERIRLGERIDHYETVRLRKDGGRLDISLSVSPIKDAAGKVIGASKIARDISEQKRIERALTEAQQQLRGYAEELEKRVQERTARLQETIKSLDSFCYSIAHDLRAPLRALVGFSSQLFSDYEGILDEPGKDFLARIKGAAARMDQLILGLLEFGRLNSAELQAETLQLSPIVRKALVPLEVEITNRGAQVELKEPLLPVRGSSLMLEQVLANLLGNALKFVPPQVVPQIVIWTEPRDGEVRVLIKDNGIGIRTEHTSKLFQPFVRLVNGSDYPGTGIGLAIVRKGVERMGGRVGVESQLGQGSCFWIELPAPSGETSKP